MATELGIERSSVFGAFSVSLVVMALAGPAVGRSIDERGGRGMLACSNLVFAAGLVLLGLASNAWLVYGAWCVLGVAMAMGLYDAAFSTLVRLHGGQARGPITGITLIAGFASTLGWPFTAFVAQHLGWQASCLAWALLHLLVALPLNLRFVPPTPRRPIGPGPASARNPGTLPERGAGVPRRAFLLLALFSAATAFVTSAMAAHLPGLLVASGASAGLALAASALLGPAQVAARLLEFMAMSRIPFHPLITARLATAMHPLGALVLGFSAGPWAACGFALLHGAGNGLITIAKGTLPLALFGAAGYGLLQGLLGMMARAMQALAPYAFGLVLERQGAQAAIMLSAGLSLIALAALAVLRSAAPSDSRR